MSETENKISGNYLQSDVDRSVTGRAVTVNTRFEHVGGPWSSTSLVTLDSDDDDDKTCLMTSKQHRSDHTGDKPQTV